MDNDVLDYLNVLLGHEEDYLFLQDIYALSPNEQVELDRLLLVFMRDYQTRKNHPVTYEEAGDLAQHIEQLRKILIQDEADEPMSRFTKSFEEIGDLFFTKSVGESVKPLVRWWTLIGSGCGDRGRSQDAVETGHPRIK